FFGNLTVIDTSNKRDAELLCQNLKKLMLRNNLLVDENFSQSSLKTFFDLDLNRGGQLLLANEVGLKQQASHIEFFVGFENKILFSKRFSKFFSFTERDDLCG